MSLDIFGVKDESLEDMENLPDRDVLAVESVENLQPALEQFGGIPRDWRAERCCATLRSSRYAVCGWWMAKLYGQAGECYLGRRGCVCPFDL